MFSLGEMADIVGAKPPAVDARPSRVVHDSRRIAEGDLFVALRGARTNGHAFLTEAFRRGACGAILAEPTLAPRSARGLIVVEDPLAALQHLASAWRERLTATIVGITGSNGKTTTRSLLAHLLSTRWSVHQPRENYNTEIGLPLALLAMPSTSEVGVFELGTQAPGEIALLASILRPTVGIVTGVGPSHLAGLRSLGAVAEEKWSLIDALPADGFAFIHADSPHLTESIGRAPCEVCTVGLTTGSVRGHVLAAVPRLVVQLAEPALRLETGLVGRHNAGNVLLAAACALRLGLRSDAVEQAVRSFESPAHRLRPLKAPFGTLLDDTYNANPSSMEAALRVLSEYGGPTMRRVFVFGDMLDLGEASERLHREILERAFTFGIDQIIPVGEQAAAACGSRSNSQRLPSDHCTQATELRGRLSGRDNVVLVKGSRALGLEKLVDELLKG